MPLATHSPPLAQDTRHSPGTRHDSLFTHTLPLCPSYRDTFYHHLLRRAHVALLCLYGVCLLVAVLYQVRLVFGWEAIAVVSWKTLRFSQILFLCVLPLFVARFLTTTVHQPKFSSATAHLLLLITAPDTWIVTGLYVTCASCILYYYLGHVLGDTYTHPLFVYPYGHHEGVRQLNQEAIFVALYGVALGVCFSFKCLCEKRSLIQFYPSKENKYVAMGTGLIEAGLAGFHLAKRVFLYCYGVHFVLNDTLYYYIAEFFGMYARILDAPINGFRWYDVYLMGRMLMGGAMTVALWEMSDTIYKTCFETIEPLSEPYANAFECLLSGMKEKDPLVQVMAYAELARRISKSPERRQHLFATVGQNGLEDSAWRQLSTECIHTLTTYLNTLTKGVPSTLDPVLPPRPLLPDPVQRIQLLTKNITAAPLSESVYLDDRSCQIFTKVTHLATGPSLPPSDVSDKAQKLLLYSADRLVSQLMQSVVHRVQHWPWIHRWNTASIQPQHRAAYGHGYVLLFAIESLGSLLAASREEDTYGYVQKDIEKVLNVLVAVLAATEAAEESNELEFLVASLKQAIYTLRVTFSDCLEDIRIERKNASHWKRFLDYTH
ncbi:nucleoporin protein Ndc1-Nup [Spinellus fusiger]|nr:nucleoporin protein Ndc1-Nup [Spinellus fusiger]